MNNGNNNSKYFTVRGLKLLDELKSIEKRLNYGTIADNNNNKSKERAVLAEILSNVTHIIGQVADIKKQFEEKLLQLHGNNSNFLADSILPAIMQMDKYLNKLRNNKKAENQERQKAEANKKKIEEEERRKKQEIANLRNKNLATQLSGIRSKINELRQNIGNSNNKYTNTTPVNIFANNTGSTNNTGARIKSEINKINTTNNKNGLLAIKKYLTNVTNQRYTLTRQNGLNKVNNKLARVTPLPNSHPVTNTSFNVSKINELMKNASSHTKNNLVKLRNRVSSASINQNQKNQILNKLNYKIANPFWGIQQRIENAGNNKNKLQALKNEISSYPNRNQNNATKKINVLRQINEKKGF
jgi:hypothetical protein